MYHAGSRALQAQFGSTQLADRLVEKLHRARFTDADQQFIESLPKSRAGRRARSGTGSPGRSIRIATGNVCGRM